MMLKILIVTRIILVFLFSFFLSLSILFAGGHNFKDVEHIRTLDGDTIEVKIDGVHSLFTKIKIRLQGINTPELKSKKRIDKIRAYKAKRFTDGILRNNKVTLRNCKQGTFFRIVCDVCYGGKNLSNELLKSKLAIWYKNKKVSLSDCK